MQGAVIVNLQETQYDRLCSLRIFAKIDDVMHLLAQELEIDKKRYTKVPMYLPQVEKKSWETQTFQVPYDENGHKCEALRKLLLEEGSKVRVTAGKFKGCEGEVVGRNLQEQYRLAITVPMKHNSNFKAKVPLLFGNWWVEGAVKGEVPYLPIVSV